MKVVGLGLAIVVLKFLLPRLFAGAEGALLAFFQALEDVFTISSGSLPAKVPSVPGL